MEHSLSTFTDYYRFWVLKPGMWAKYLHTLLIQAHSMFRFWTILELYTAVKPFAELLRSKNSPSNRKPADFEIIHALNVWTLKVKILFCFAIHNENISFQLWTWKFTLVLLLVLQIGDQITKYIRDINLQERSWTEWRRRQIDVIVRKNVKLTVYHLYITHISQK